MAEHSTSAKALTEHEPVLDEAKIAGRVVAGTTAAFAVATALGLHVTADVSTVTAAEVAVLGCSVGAVNWLVPRWRAWRARHAVTPLANPHTATGEQLVTTASVARSAKATAAARIDPAPEPVDSPMEQSATIVRDSAVAA